MVRGLLAGCNPNGCSVSPRIPTQLQTALTVQNIRSSIPNKTHDDAHDERVLLFTQWFQLTQFISIEIFHRFASIILKLSAAYLVYVGNHLITKYMYIIQSIRFKVRFFFYSK